MEYAISSSNWESGNFTAHDEMDSASAICERDTSESFLDSVFDRSASTSRSSSYGDGSGPEETTAYAYPASATITNAKPATVIRNRMGMVCRTTFTCCQNAVTDTATTQKTNANIAAAFEMSPIPPEISGQGTARAVIGHAIAKADTKTRISVVLRCFMCVFIGFNRFGYRFEPILHSSELNVRKQGLRLRFAVYEFRAREASALVRRRVGIFQHRLPCGDPSRIVGFSKERVFELRFFERFGICGEFPIRLENRETLGNQRGSKFFTGFRSAYFRSVYRVVDEAIGFRTMGIRFR